MTARNRAALLEFNAGTERARRAYNSEQHRFAPKPPKPEPTCCNFGHDYTPANTYMHSSGRRICRECGRLRAQAARDRKKALR